MTTVPLAGCRAEPLLSYLKGLGTFRLVVEQRDPAARAWWQGGELRLESSLDPQELIAFLVEGYIPTPIVTPWNGRGGFDPAKNRLSEKVVRLFETTDDPRLGELRRTIAAAREVYDRATSNGWDRTRDKKRWIQACRAHLPDAAVSWIDAAVVLIEDGVAYPPLLGSGGNFGSFDAANNFLQRLAEVLCLRRGRTAPTRADAAAWAESALFGQGDPPLVQAKTGQFDPGRAGESKSSPLGERGLSLLNPWDYVLGLEGTLLFASAAARRLGARRAQAAMPFTVSASPAGYAAASAAESGLTSEIWTPLWTRPATLAEIRRLLGEGRSTWGRGQARTGLDFARAATSLGVDRGVDEFVRHAILPRFGKSPLAVPAGRVQVQARADVAVLRQLDRWTEPLRQVERRRRPARVSAALHRLDRAQFGLARRGGTRLLQEVLIALARLESAVAVTTAFRDRRAPAPVRGLTATEWVPRLDDGSAEFRLAAALASSRDRLPGARDLTAAEQHGSQLAHLLRSVRLQARSQRLEWTGTAPRAPGLMTRRTTLVLAAAHRQRVVAAGARADRRPGGASVGQPATGVLTAYDLGLPASIPHVAAIVRGDVDEARLGRLLAGLALLDWSGSPDDLLPLPEVDPAFLAPPSWAVLAPFFHGLPVPATGDSGHPGRAHLLVPQRSWVNELVAGRVERVVAGALLRLRMARLQPALSDVAAVARGVDGTRLAAALATRLPRSGARDLLCRVVTGASADLANRSAS